MNSAGLDMIRITLANIQFLARPVAEAQIPQPVMSTHVT